jgi:glycosyltransferase involved in cell wall biosynthesis
MKMEKLTIVMPVYNEEDSLPIILNDWLELCKSARCQLVVVNDGSSDRSVEILQNLQKAHGFSILNHKVNKGYGGAIKTGIKAVETEYLVTIDADGQHQPQNVVSMYDKMIAEDGDLLIGARMNESNLTARSIGKWMIRVLSRILLPNRIMDLNSGLKMYRTDLAKRYIKICPDSMAFSDIMALTFIAEKCKVLEIPIQIKPRVGGKSKINLRSAIDTVVEIINIVVFFNPLRLFLPLALIFLLAGLAWGLPIVLAGRGVSTGALLAFTISGIVLLLGLIAEQLSQIRRMLADDRKD